MSSHFYHHLPPHRNFSDMLEPATYTPVPEDWLILVGDVEGSTPAIQQGRYKEVNIVGAGFLMAVLNALQTTDVPFVFGGDGATLVLPPDAIRKVRPLLPEIQSQALRAFDFKLRVGIVPVSEIRTSGAEVAILKLKISDRFCSAAFSGGGLRLAEEWIRPDDSQWRMGQPSRGTPGPSQLFSGLECRWHRIPNPGGKMVSLLIAPRGDAAAWSTYRDWSAFTTELSPRALKNPIQLPNLTVTTNGKDLTPENRLKNRNPGGFGAKLGLIWKQFETAVGKAMMDYNINLPGMPMGRYKKDVLRNTDYYKFDDMLRVVLALTDNEIEELTTWLDAREAAGEIDYGMHIAAEAIVTCLIFERNGGHLHLLDVADGGYASAAKQMKLKTGRNG